jgi:hypothetical protein
MFENLHNHARVLHGEMVGIFWIILPSLVAVLIVLEILKNDDSGPNVASILKRVLLCIFMLWSFDFVVNIIAMVSDGITHKIRGTEDVWQALKQLGPDSSKSSGSMFDIREHIVYFFAIASYLIAYIGFFASTALVNFVWAILYIVAPLIFPCFVARTTAPIVANLYRGLISVATWKILWTLLGSLLIKMAMNPKIVGIEDYFLSMVINLLIGLSMLLIPLFTRSLISDGLQSAASGLAAAPGLLTARSMSMAAKKLGKKGVSKGIEGAQFASKPLTNPFTSRAKVLAHKHKLKQRFNKAKKSYADFGMSQEAKDLRSRQLKKRHAIKHSYQNKRKGGQRRARKRKK